MALCLSIAVPNNIYAETSQPITDEQNKQIQAASAYIEKLMEARQYSMACALAYELTRRFPNEPIGYYLLGTARMDSGYYEAAIKAYDDCVNVDSKYYLGQKGFEFVTNPKYKNRAQINSDIMQCQKANQQFNWNGDFVFEELSVVKDNKEIMERDLVVLPYALK